ncbi:hypothetical protein VTL71DRAFT_16042 [Oculimacula yallundae]|uniref:Uncharacterized protein n=1 Tax=Oculimacula yallundae TaxID=86028 RepID=A0ABR4CDC3_9HELO
MILKIPYLAASVLNAVASASIVEIPNLLAARQTNTTSEEDYLSQVCYPNTTSPVTPPCQEIINIQSACTPNGTSGIYLLAHAQCMCGGSFFADWIGCLNCAYVHGARSPQNVDSFHTIITSASQALCTGTPTASFAAIFSSLSEGAAPTGTDTVKSDRFPEQTDIGLYYTVSGVQGVGAITGEAISATRTVSSMSGSQTGTRSGTGSQTTASAGESGTAGAVASSSSSQAGAAMPTGVWCGAVGAMVGAVGIAVL